MAIYVLTSMFSEGFDVEISKRMKQLIKQGSTFAFVASEFESSYEKTDRYCSCFLKMFEKAGICFNDTYVIDGRMSGADAQKVVKMADVVWLSGGDSPKQFAYLKKYGLDQIIKEHTGIIMGMSAGAINLAKTSICTISSGHKVQAVYDGLGCVDISVEPHFNEKNDCQEILELSKKHKAYGLCDESMIIYNRGSIEYYGIIFEIHNKKITRIVGKK
ncbi:MAG: Type 1 glutamine amidotransferase-like domain-containing protein [Clostridia bacterium]|nr:Type 1 glutamine amidotransferase-like domain-containing protein [Clostridia bacterium]